MEHYHRHTDFLCSGKISFKWHFGLLKVSIFQSLLQVSWAFNILLLITTTYIKATAQSLDGNSGSLHGSNYASSTSSQFPGCKLLTASHVIGPCTGGITCLFLFALRSRTTCWLSFILSYCTISVRKGHSLLTTVIAHFYGYYKLIYKIKCIGILLSYKFV